MSQTDPLHSVTGRLAEAHVAAKRHGAIWLDGAEAVMARRWQHASDEITGLLTSDWPLTWRLGRGRAVSHITGRCDHCGTVAVALHAAARL